LLLAWNAGTHVTRNTASRTQQQFKESWIFAKATVNKNIKISRTKTKPKQTKTR
jgi:hypothetical protein